MNQEKFAERSEIPEQFPSQEEIKSVFETLLQGQEYTELRVQSDETGVSLYEIEVALEDGEKIEYNYQRATYDFKRSITPPGRTVFCFNSYDQLFC